MANGKTVTMPVESWRTVQAILIREALWQNEHENPQKAAEIMDLLVPRIEGVVDSRALEVARVTARKMMGMPALGTEVTETE